MSRVVHFEIYAQDPDVLEEFYSSVFDWTVEQYEESEADYRMIRTGPAEEPGIDGGLLRWNEPEWGEQPHGWAYVCTVSVDDIDAALEAIVANGGTIDVEPMEIPGVGTHAYCTDPAGNYFGVMESIEGESPNP